MIAMEVAFAFYLSIAW